MVVTSSFQNVFMCECFPWSVFALWSGFEKIIKHLTVLLWGILWLLIYHYAIYFINLSMCGQIIIKFAHACMLLSVQALNAATKFYFFLLFLYYYIPSSFFSFTIAGYVYWLYLYCTSYKLKILVSEEKIYKTVDSLWNHIVSIIHVFIWHHCYSVSLSNVSHKNGMITRSRSHITPGYWCITSISVTFSIEIIQRFSAMKLFYVVISYENLEISAQAYFTNYIWIDHLVIIMSTEIWGTYSISSLPDNMTLGVP